MDNDIKYTSKENEILELSDVPLSSPAARIPVPRGDQKIALSAIENQLAIEEKNWRRKNCTPENQGNHGTKHIQRLQIRNKDDSPCRSKDEFVLECLREGAASLKHQLESITYPVCELELEQKLDEYQNLYFANKPLSPEFDDSDESLSSSGDEADEIELDDEELLDKEAYNKVRSLRHQAREMSARVIAKREEVSERALSFAHRSLSELLRVHGFSSLENEKDEGLDSDKYLFRDDNKSNHLDEDCSPVKSMHVALNCLTSSLKKIDKNIAEKLDLLQETLETIDLPVEKYHKMNESEGNMCLRRETAQLSMSYQEPRRNRAGEEKIAQHNNIPTNPDQRLALLLADAM